ncbi:MAG: hypothetical protein GWO16_12980, partial [Gammaproteobacteria bacterium]|nr:hypothetical protein [Gammaproteobacteria bacterium]
PQYCCFYLHQQLRIGRVCADGGTHLELMLPDGRQVRQRAANMLYCWEGDPAADAKAAQAQLVAAEAALAGQQAHLDALYARMAPGEPMPFDALVELALGPEATGWGRGLLFAALLRDGLRYRFSKDAFTARSPEEVTERAAEQERRQRQQAWVDKVLAWREQFEAGTWESADDPDVPEFLEQLRSVLALERRSPHWALLSRPLGLHNLHVLDIATRIKSWLQLADGWPGWPDIWLRWGEVPRDFSPEVHSAARPLAAAPVRREDRRDFTA